MKLPCPSRPVLLALGAAAALLVAASPLRAQTVDAEVRKVDKAQGKVTLAHGEIRNLDMPPMTMTFRVANPAWLDQLAEGTKVKFDADKVNGQYTVVRLSVVK